MELASKITNSILDLANDLLAAAGDTWKKVELNGGKEETETPISAGDCLSLGHRIFNSSCMKDALRNKQNSLVYGDFMLFPRQVVNCNISKVGTRQNMANIKTHPPF